MAGNTSNLTFKLFGKDVSASKAFRGVGSTAGGLSRGLGGLGAAFAGIGTAAVVAGGMVAIDFGKQSVDAFQDAQVKAALFDDAMSRFKGLSSYKGKLDALSQSLALKTKFDDDETKAAIATLARYNLTGKQLETLTPLVQDYAVATGRDLGSASTIVGKAMLGNAKALKELGINFKPTGDKAKDFAAITDLLTKKVGGFAEKEGKTATGTSEILANQFGELKETVGSYLVPALQTLSRFVLDYVIPALQIAAAWVGEHLGPVFRALGDWIMNVGWPAIQNLAKAFMENVWPAIQQVAAMIAENLQPVVESLADFWTNTLLPGIQDLIPIVQKVATVIGVVVGALLVAITFIVGKVAPVFFNILGGAVRFIIALLGKIIEWIQKVVGWFVALVGFIGGLGGKIASAASGMWDGLKSGLGAVVNWIIDRINNILDTIRQSIDGFNSLPGPDIPFSVPHLSHVALAKGGIVTRPTLALIGEAGPEAVIPLSGRNRGAGGVTINITQPLGTPQQIGRVVLDAMRQAQGSGRAVINF